MDDRRGAERGVRGDGDGVRRVHLRHLVDGDDVAREIEARAAKLLGPRDAEQAELSHAAHVLPRELRRLVVRGGDGRDLALREATNELTHGVVLVAEVQAVVHGWKGNRRYAASTDAASRIAARKRSPYFSSFAG